MRTRLLHPSDDWAVEVAKAIFEENRLELYRAYLKAALKGNGYIFEVLANRGFGKLKERVEIDRGPYRELSDEDLQRQIADLERKLGVPASTPELLPQADDGSKTKPN